MKETSRKTDRRTLYTRAVICEAFLNLKKIKSYNDITVTDICRKAEISRGTFYLHYNNISEVLEEVLQQALSKLATMNEQIRPTFCAAKENCSYPLCQFIRNSEEYRCLFFDDMLSPYILKIIYEKHKDDVIKAWADKTRLSPKQLSMLAYFQLSGCFSAAKLSGGLSDQEWKEIQAVIDAFIYGGLQSFPTK